MKTISLLLMATVVSVFTTEIHAQKRDMTFMDQLVRPRSSQPVISDDGMTAAYTISSMSWKTRERNADIWITDILTGSIRQMTFTEDKNESSPQFSSDGKGIFFLSNRNDKNHLYFMRLDGGEAILLTKSHKDGVSNFALSNNGMKLVFAAKTKDRQQLWVMDADMSGSPEQLTNHKSSVGTWKWSMDDNAVYFLAGDEDDVVSRKRQKYAYNVDHKSELGIANHLWKISVDGKRESQLTRDGSYSETNFILSKDGNWMGITRQPHRRYTNPFDASPFRNLYLYNIRTGEEEQLTDMKVGKGGFGFSEDSKTVYYAMNDDGVYQRNRKIYVRPVTGDKSWYKLIPDQDVTLNGGFTIDGKTFYLTIGEGVRRNIFKTESGGNDFDRITDTQGVVSTSYNDKTGKVIVSYSDPHSPQDYYITDITNLGNKDSWKRLTNTDPEVADFNLSNVETITWKSKDGTMVEGLLYTPHDYDPNRKYPLIVKVHGGPASAIMREFYARKRYYPNLYTANNYAVFFPNYRGSDNYGNKFRMEIAGNYFQRGYEDIMTGVDYLIDRGVAHPDSLGHMGWSAGGHWSNWALVSTDRFKAISSGAGGMNWVSMYAQTDVQAPREFYFEGTPYDNFKGFWDVSPLKYIKKAKTPTLIHVVKGDPRVPAPQSHELYMALQKLGVTSEFMEYPGNTHGINAIRHQMIKIYTEFMWFEKWIRGKDEWFDWDDLIAMVENGTIK